MFNNEIFRSSVIVKLRQLEGKVLNPKYLLQLCKIAQQRAIDNRLEGKTYNLDKIGVLPPLEEGYKKKIKPRKKRIRARRRVDITIMTFNEALGRAKG